MSTRVKIGIGLSTLLLTGCAQSTSYPRNTRSGYYGTTRSPTYEVTRQIQEVARMRRAWEQLRRY